MKQEAGGQVYPTDHRFGMWLRDYFAAEAMRALIAGGHGNVMGWKAEHFATAAYNVADALLAERAK